MNILVRLIERAQQRRALLKILFGVCLGGIVCVGLTLTPEAGHLPGDQLPLFWSCFGLLGCIGLAGVCKWIAKTFLERDTDYYDH